ncbi:MAG: SufE family protein [Thermoanaerobaculia bacterium]
MAEVTSKLQRLLDGLRLLPDRGERIQLLIEIADRFRGVPAEVAARPYPAERLVPHCESEAYFWARDLPGGRLRFHFAVENPQGISAKAMAVILDETLSAEPLEEVARVPLDVPYEIFGRELSMGKTMGLLGMVGLVKQAAAQRLRNVGGPT